MFMMKAPRGPRLTSSLELQYVNLIPGVHDEHAVVPFCLSIDAREAGLMFFGTSICIRPHLLDVNTCCTLLAVTKLQISWAALQYRHL